MPATFIDAFVTTEGGPLEELRIPMEWGAPLSAPAGLARFTRTVDFLRANRRRHDQTMWITEGRTAAERTACAAGWTTLLAGAVPHLDSEIRAELAIGGRAQIHRVDYRGETRGIRGLAMELLELELGFALELFSATNALADIERMYRLAQLSTQADFDGQHWTLDGWRAPSADTIAQLTFSR
jgi:hypothetical protein